ncbi:MAG: hypothetical protein ABIP68_05920 [Ferruginibacter sp.]
MVCGFMFMISCGKSEPFNPQGGLLPSKYIFLKDSTYDPISLDIVRGGSIVFVNNTPLAHTLISDDSVTFKVDIPLGMSVYVRPDTLITAPLAVQYHCIQHPNARGLITIYP